MDQVNLKLKIDQACKIAEEFVRLYYETVDGKRHLISRLYEDTGLLVWNGNEISGNENIQEFLTNLPSTLHTITTLDAQPILDSSANNELSLIIQVSGSVQYQENPTKTFHQNFVVRTLVDWKIISDSFRIQDYSKCNIKK